MNYSASISGDSTSPQQEKKVLLALAKAADSLSIEGTFAFRGQYYNVWTEPHSSASEAAKVAIAEATLVTAR